MAQIKIPKAYRVDLYEYERGCGPRLHKKVYFDNEGEARDYVVEFNNENTEGYTPDWYMVAQYRGKIE